MATGRCVEQALQERERERERGRDPSLREAQAAVVSSSTVRSAMAFECFRISTVKRFSTDALHAVFGKAQYLSHDATTRHVFAQRPYSDSIQEPDDELDLEITQ